MNDSIIVECRYQPPHTHEYPSDWLFGGANGKDPREDPRHRPSTYEYLDAGGHSVFITQAPLCDDAALDQFTFVASCGLKPVYLAKILPGETKAIPLPYCYIEKEDTVYPL